MFKRKHEIENLKVKVSNRDKLIETLERKNNKLNQENAQVYEENKDLRFENDELKEFKRKIKNFVTSNTYNNEKIILGKIIELVHEYESIN